MTNNQPNTSTRCLPIFSKRRPATKLSVPFTKPKPTTSRVTGKVTRLCGEYIEEGQQLTNNASLMLMEKMAALAVKA